MRSSKIILLIFSGFGFFLNANDEIEKLILRIDIDKIRILFDADLLLRSEDKERYINACMKNMQKLKSEIDEKKLNKQDIQKIAYGLIGFYAFNKSLIWLNFFKHKNVSVSDLRNDDYEVEITTAFKYLSYAASPLLFYFSIKELYEGLTRKFILTQYKKTIAILAMLDRMSVRKDI